MMEALKRQVGGGFQALDNYVLMEAAVPAHCYDALAPSFSELVDLEAVTATPDVYRDYMNMTNAVRGSLINFFNADDFALNSWIFNQKVRKPHISLGYSSDGTNGFRDSLTIIDPKELMPFVARPRSLAVGAQGATSGAIMDSLDLKVQFGFGGASSDHSGQYLRNFQNVWPFYFSLLDRLNP